MNKAKQRPKWLESWLNDILADSNFKVKPIQLINSNQWALVGGSIIHKSDLFFKIVGVKWKNPDGNITYQPLIEQREIGTLGFWIDTKLKEPEIVVQSKIEPGNVGVVQLAPSYQATASNSAKVHGGKSPPLKEQFLKSGQKIIYQTLNSEQGTRFLGKLNRNILVKTNKKITLPRTHRWIIVDQLLDLLPVDYLVNTDARSVLVCSPWDLLVKRPSFSKYKTPYAKDLRKSYEVKDNSGLPKLINDIKKLRDLILEHAVIDLGDLVGWRINKYGVTPLKTGSFSVRQIRIVAHGREVPTWDQPIIDSHGEGYVELVCARKNGILYFLFKPQIEPGLYYRVELGPSVVVPPGESVKPVAAGKVVIESWQSDEGGRFFQDITHYKIVDIGNKPKSTKHEYWLSLGQVSTLLQQGGWFTNEARSVLSLLLYWL